MNRLLARLVAGSAGDDLTDRQLLDRFTLHRDEAAFAELVRRHGPLVWGVCRRNLPNPPDAEDAFQATFLVLVRRVAGLPPHSALGPWLHKVAAWCCRTVRRTNRRRLDRVRVGLSGPVPSPEPAADPDLAAALDAAVLALPQKYRVPVVLCHLQGWSRQQAAEHLGCPEGTLSARLSRALAKLRARLADRDPAATLAVAGALAAPPAVASAAVRAAIIYTTATGTIPPAVLSTTNGVLRMFRMKKLRLAAVALLMAVGLAWVGAGLTARPTPSTGPAEPPPARPTGPPTLKPGKWVLAEWMSPNVPRQEAVLTVAEKDGKPAITAVESDVFTYQPKALTISGRRVTFTITRNGPLDRRFDGLFDPADPTRVLGSLWDGTSTVERAVLELAPPTGPGKLPKPDLPPEWLRYVELGIAYNNAAIRADDPQFQKKPAAEQATLRAAAAKAEEAYFAEVPKLCRKLVAEQPNRPFGYWAAMELFGMLKRMKPAPAEVDAWAKAARTFAATHGPQFEAGTVGQIARVLTRHEDYLPQARAYAAEADKLATAVGMPATYSQVLAERDGERAVWATLKNPPAAGSVWTVTVTGRVTNAKGEPVPDAEVLVNNTRGVKLLTQDESYKTKSGPDGRYTITLKCQGSARVQIYKMWAEKKGFVRAEHTEIHKLLPGQSATVEFTLKPGERFGGTLKIRPNAFERMSGPDDLHFLEVTGPDVAEWITVKNGGTFELTLPPGAYTVELNRGGGKKLTWSNLKTGRTDHVLEEPPFRFTPDAVGAGFDEMWKRMDRSYSYFALKPDVDWVKLRDEYRPKAVKAKSAEELADVLKEMLGRLKDGHVWIEMPDGQIVGTHRTPWAYNGNRKVIDAQLTDVTKCGDYVVIGKTKPDGFGYFLMAHQSAATPELVAKAVAAIGKLADAPGFVIDLRNANGGSEPFAQQIAQLFCEKTVVYAKSRYRNGPGHGDFTDDQPRMLPAAQAGKPFLKPVVCLLGPGCVSSGEGFAKMMAALPHVTTVGLPTRGSSGNPAPVEVGDTGLVVYFSQWVDLLPDGTPIEGKGVPPRVRVDEPAAAYQDADPTLAKGLEVLRENVKLKK